MSKDLMFRTSAFGGFKKDEVMDFIEKILNEKSSLERQISACKKENSQLQTEVENLENQVAEIERLRSQVAEVEVLRSEANSLDSEINSLKSEIEQCEIAMDDKDTLIKELTERLSDAQSRAADDSELVTLKIENERLQTELSKKGDLERQVGAAMLDARLHSEELVEQAKEKANNVTKAVYAAIGDTALKIDDLSAGIGEIARSFTKSVEEVELRIKALTGNMSKTAQALISENVLNDAVIVNVDETVEVVETPKAEYDFFATIVDDKIGDEDY